MTAAKIVSEHGSFRLIESNGRFAVVEKRNDRVYGAQCDGDERPSAPDTPSGMVRVVEPTGWIEETEARRLFDEVKNRGDDLARTIW